jgi:hypothetical protein
MLGFLSLAITVSLATLSPSPSGLRTLWLLGILRLYWHICRPRRKNQESHLKGEAPGRLCEVIYGGGSIRAQQLLHTEFKRVWANWLAFVVWTVELTIISTSTALPQLVMSLNGYGFALIDHLANLLSGLWMGQISRTGRFANGLEHIYGEVSYPIVRNNIVMVGKSTITPVKIRNLRISHQPTILTPLLSLTKL